MILVFINYDKLLSFVLNDGGNGLFCMVRLALNFMYKLLSNSLILTTLHLSGRAP